MIRDYATLCRRARSDDPDVAFPAMVRLGYAQTVNPAIDTGWKTYKEGRLFLPVSPNICPDPQGTLADGTFWPASTAHTAITANQALPVLFPDDPVVTKCLKLVNDGTADTPATANLTVTASVNNQVSLYIFCPVLGGNLTITAETGDSHTVAAVTAANAGWVRYSVNAHTSAGQTTLHLHLAFAGGTASTVYITACNSVQGGLVVPYFDGGSPGCSWAGTAHASASNSAFSVLVYPVPTGLYTAGTMACACIPLWDGTHTTNRNLLWIENSAGDSNTVRLSHVGADTKWTGTVRSTTSLTIASAAQSFAAESRHTLVLRWTQATGTLDLNYDGTDATQVSQTKTLAPGVWFAVGQRSTAGVWNTEPLAGWISSVVLASSSFSGADVTLLQASSGALFSQPVSLAYWLRQKYPGSMLLPLRTDSVGYALCR